MPLNRIPMDMVDGLTSNLADIAIDVKSAPYNAKGDGVTNDSSAFQAANDYLSSIGGGVLYVPKGTYITNFTIDSNIILKGSGINNTILMSAPNSNKDVIQGRNFSTLTGASTLTATDGVRFIQIQDLTVDGNKANNTSGYGIRIFGCYWYWNNLIVQNCVNDGIWTEFYTVDSPTPTNFRDQLLETMYRNIKTAYNNGNGWTYNGPHDSIIDNYVAIENTGYALYQRSTKAFLTGENWNAWLNGNGYYIGAGLAGHDIVSDNGNSGIGLEFGATSSNSRIANARFSGFDKGIIVRGSTNVINAVIANCGVNNDGSAVVIDQTSSNILDIIATGNNRVFDVISETSGSVITAKATVSTGKTFSRGTFRSDDFLNFNLGGAGQGTLVQFSDNTIQCRGWTMSLPLANGNILTDQVLPTSTKRGGVKQQTAPANLTSAPTATDFNNLIALLKTSGVLA